MLMNSLISTSEKYDTLFCRERQMRQNNLSQNASSLQIPGMVGLKWSYHSLIWFLVLNVINVLDTALIFELHALVSNGLISVVGMMDFYQICRNGILRFQQC